MGQEIAGLAKDLADWGSKYEERAVEQVLRL